MKIPESIMPVIFMIAAFQLLVCCSAQQQKSESNRTDMSANSTSKSCDKIVEPSLGISFCIPPKWTVELQNGDKYHVAFGEDRNGFSPNIGINAATNSISLSEYVKKGVEYVLQNKNKLKVSSVELVSQAEFAATSTSGYRIAYNSTPEESKFKFRTIQYVFNGDGDTKVTITATMLFSEKDDLEKIIDDAIKTFQVTK